LYKTLYIAPVIIRERNIILQSRHQRAFLADVSYLKTGREKPIVIFSHGFQGFKDWGPFDLVADIFAEQGFVFVKFNFSHNGTTPDHPVDFVDLESFANDNFSIELDDLGVVIDWLFTENFPVDAAEADTSEIYLIGHSRGGGISILKAREDERVKKVCTWASLNEVGKYWTEEQLQKIKEDGVTFIKNSRTLQQLPIRWQMYEDYFANLERLYIPAAVKELKQPLLIIHGTKDETVPVSCALEMKDWNKKADLFLVENGTHVFGAKHPWKENKLPPDFEVVVNETLKFFRTETGGA
jgi:pimeloyl-ACP methyl ester carboxylesterase